MPKAPQLSESDQLFALEYLKNGLNATGAYKAVHPRCSQRTAEANGYKLLRKTEVAAFIRDETEKRKARLQMEGDEALEGLTRIGRADIRRLYRNNRLLPISEWPDLEGDCVKSLKPTPFGTQVVMHDKMRARELMAINAGKLKLNHTMTHKFDHAAYLGAEPPKGDDE